MSEPTRLTAEDLPTLIRLADWFDERGQCVFTAPGERRWWRVLLRQVVCRATTELMQRAILAVQNTGHLASDERVDKYGRVSRP